MTRTVKACPACDTTKIYRRCGHDGGHSRAPRRGDPDANYRCGNCGATFDDPVVREAGQDGSVGQPSPDTMLRRAGVDPDEIRERLGVDS